MKRPTRWAIGLLAAIGAFSALLAVAALLAGGIGWDAPIDARTSEQIRLVNSGSTLQQAYDFMYSTTEFYGVLLQQLADWVHMMATRTVAPLSSVALETYRWQALVNTLIAFAGAACLGLAVGVALRSRLAGVFSWACLMTTPLYIGMSPVDFKDIPVAAGFTAMTSGLVLSHACTRRLAAYSASLLMAVTGAVVALGVRPGAWPLLVVLCTVSLAAFAVSDARRRTVERLLPGLVASLASFVAAVGVLWITNPIARIDVATWLVDTFRVASRYPVQGVVRTLGQDLPTSDLPWWYVPVWLLAQLPLMTTIAIAVGTGAWLACLAGARWAPLRGRAVDLAPVSVQAFVLPALIVLGGAVLYDGIRHLLFMIPALCGMAGVGVAALEARAESSSNAMGLAAAAAAIGVAAFGLFANIRWFPYSYAFINPVAASLGDTRTWELDYWGASALEGVHRLRAMGVDHVVVLPTDATSLGVDAGADPPIPLPLSRPYGLYFFPRGNLAFDTGECTPTFTIQRDGLELGSGWICTGSRGIRRSG